jgi:hypothetical protein
VGAIMKRWRESKKERKQSLYWAQGEEDSLILSFLSFIDNRSCTVQFNSVE